MKNKYKKNSTEIDYHDEVSYDSVRENWSGVVGLLLVPLLILGIGIGVYNGVSNKNIDTYKNAPGPGGGIQYGIGGAPPTVSPSIQYNQPYSQPLENLEIIQ